MDTTTKQLNIAIASGKGGTGKTTVSVNLLKYIHKYWTKRIELIDCDVEEPNAALFHKEAVNISVKDTFQLIPNIDLQKCVFCRECVKYCEFNAIVVLPSVEFAEINKSLCHSCGACTFACAYGAINEQAYKLGEVREINTANGTIKEGRLKVGSAMQTMMIKELKKEIDPVSEVHLLDSSPGTSCPVVATVADADYVILVTEPTPFGLHDLKLTVALLQEINKPFGVIINKAGVGNSEVYDFLKDEQIELIGNIPFSKEYAASYAQGKLFNETPESIRSSYIEIVSLLKDKLS